jgi:hypothetical protein
MNPKPWNDPLFVGPTNRRPIDRASRRADKRQHRAAVNAWEYEGGSLGTPTDRQAAADSNRKLSGPRQNR